jgi:predicted PurR-regulated permease PerM
LNTLIIAVVVVGALYFARDVFVPLALALLLSFALGPLVMMLRRWRFGRVPSVIAGVVLASLIIFGIGGLIGSQLAGLAENLPQYRYNMVEKIHSLRSAAVGSGILGPVSKMLDDLKKEISRPAEPPPAPDRLSGPSSSPNQQKPVPVEIRQPAETPAEVIQGVAGPLLPPLAMTGIVVVFVIFFLLQREDLRDRFIRLAGARDLNRTTRALDDAASRLSRYLLTQCAINACFGVLIGFGLWLIGVQSPLLWGLLAMLLRFVPYIGPVIAAGFPAAVAFAVDPGWSTLLWTIGLFLLVEPIMGQVLEPWLYGHSTGLSPVAVVVAAAFWTWLWGPIGLLVSTPLTLCLVVIGRHVERLEFLNIALGNRPALEAEESFYQRMLAGDSDEAVQQAEEFLKKAPLVAYYDQIAILGLALAQQDVNRGALDRDRRLAIKESVDGVIADLSDHENAPPPGAAAGEPATPRQEAAAAGWEGGVVLCVSGRGALDETVAAMLAQLLGKQGIGARVVPSNEVSAANMPHFDTADAEIACLSYLEAGGLTNARYLIRRLRRKRPATRIILGLWTLSEEAVESRNALGETGADVIVTSLAQAIAAVRDAAAHEMGPVREVVSMQEAGRST